MDELSEAELRYYNDLFKICSESSDGSGKIPALKATSLFRSANLSNEVINKITSLVGIPQTALHLSRQQFYGCLKLIAAYQASVPLREEILTSTLTLPLPQFSWIESPTALPPPSGSSSGGAGITSSSSAISERNGYGSRSTDYKVMKIGRDLIELTTTSSSSSRERVDNVSNSGDMTNSDQPSTDSEVDHNEESMLRSVERHHVIKVKGHGTGRLVGGGVGGNSSGVGGSPEAWSTASDSPTPTNSVAERPWANQALWQGLVCEEQRQLLGTEEESSDKHSSDDDQEADLEYFYQISQTQKEYYLKQFRSIQSDVHGLVSGQVARVFFEKSRIPIEELRHIWQMCDVTRDGALNLAEFTAAMHLVVLRRNNIPVPATLPACLMPNLLQSSLLPGANSGLQNQHSGGSAGGASAGSAGTGTESINSTRERTGPEEADLLHLESDDNTDNGSQVTVDKKEYQRILSHQEPLKLNHQLPSASSTATVTLVSVGSTDSPPAISSTTNSSKLINTVSGRKTPTNLASPPHHPQKAKHSNEQPVTPPNNLNKEWNASSKEWTKFTESPTSNVSSPGPKPVNFDMQRTTQAIVSDPQILHPVPLRVTPVGAEAADNSNLVYSDVTVGTGGILIVQRDDSSPKQLAQQLPQPVSNQRDSLTSGDLRAIQRPQPKKPPSKGVGAIPPPPQREPSITSSSGSAGTADSMATSLDTATFNSVINNITGQAPVSTLANSASKKDQPPPPLPPPRPVQHRHTRSSSLDLNKFKLNTASGASAGLSKQLDDQLRMPPPPEVPPRVTPTSEQSPAPGFADFAHFPNTPVAGGSHMVSAENNITTILLDASGNMTTATHHTTGVRGNVTGSLITGPPSLQTVSRNSAFEVYRKPQQQHSRGSQSPPHPPPPLVSSRSVESSSLEYEKRISTLTDNLRQVRFKGTESANGSDVLKHLKEQNMLLLRICSDLSEELLQIQQKREDIKIKIDLQEQNLGASAVIVTGGGQPGAVIGLQNHIA
ncbi:ralBP1-associated Eps domain-containing protein 1-like [Topomyia yanbarensis]|uniref:ralBP1-associated Eps domain-containing protein 1-like n=1 Tax=Topomyia yanbarensis TaxID=2498891 RepID=UPI00273A7B40|nr:ralBP1-associated Eps domain-containing protein 1-like [Topomyia yanbarensis]